MGIYIFRDDKVQGPFDEVVLRKALSDGFMSPEEMCCRDGSENWVAASNLFSPNIQHRFHPDVSTNTQELSSKRKTLLAFWREASIPMRVVGGIVVVGSCLLCLSLVLIIGAAMVGASQSQPAPTVQNHTERATILSPAAQQWQKKAEDYNHTLDAIAQKMDAMHKDFEARQTFMTMEEGQTYAQQMAVLSVAGQKFEALRDQAVYERNRASQNSP